MQFSFHILLCSHTRYTLSVTECSKLVFRSRRNNIRKISECTENLQKGKNFLKYLPEASLVNNVTEKCMEEYLTLSPLIPGRPRAPGAPTEPYKTKILKSKKKLWGMANNMG